MFYEISIALCPAKPREWGKWRYSKNDWFWIVIETERKHNYHFKELHFIPLRCDWFEIEVGGKRWAVRDWWPIFQSKNSSWLECILIARSLERFHILIFRRNSFENQRPFRWDGMKLTSLNIIYSRGKHCPSENVSATKNSVVFANWWNNQPK